MRLRKCGDGIRTTDSLLFGPLAFMLQDVRILDATRGLRDDARCKSRRNPLGPHKMEPRLRHGRAGLRGTGKSCASCVARSGGVSEISLDLESARLPDGVWLSGPAAVENLANGFSVFRASAIAPAFGKGATIEGNATCVLTLRAKHVFAVISERSAIPGQFGIDSDQRRSLATDEQLLLAATEVLRGKSGGRETASGEKRRQELFPKGRSENGPRSSDC